MRVPAQLSEESLFGFLTSTRLPVVSSLSALIRWGSLLLAIGGASYALACVAFVEAGLWNPRLPWSGALPAAMSAPLFFIAWRGWRRHRLENAAKWLFAAMFTLTIAANWPRGAFSPAWFLHPVLAMLAATSLGVVPGLSMTLVAVFALLLATWVGRGDFGQGVVGADVWVHSTSLAAVTLASALAGVILNRLVFLALLTAESQRRKNFESSRALRHREKLLRHALRVETVGDLASMVCHQLRNTFQVVEGHVTLGEMEEEADARRRLASIKEAVQESQPLLDQLMRLAHPDEGSTVACDLAELLRQFHRQARVVLPHYIQLTCEVPQATPLVLLDPDGLLHALWNLVINAKQAIGSDGAITLRCGSDRHQVWIEVADTGPGMPPEVKKRVFDPYFTTKPIGQGTGLGLTAVARYVRGSNGIVQVDSEPGRGTTFRMRFPHAHGLSEERSGQSSRVG